MDLIDRAGRAQHGLVTRDQLLGNGISSSGADRWMGAFRLEVVHPGVYRLAGAPRTWDQAVLAAVLAARPSAAASHRTAALIWDLLEDRDQPVEISVPRPAYFRLKDVTVHRSRDLDESWVSVRNGIRVTNPLMTMLDLGAVLPAFLVEDCLDRGLGNRLFTIAGLEWARARVARPGRRGAGVLGKILDERALGSAPAVGLLEPRMARLLKTHSLPAAEFQYSVYDNGRFVGRPDFAYPSARLAIEVDGYEVHSTKTAFQHDLDRQNALVLAGWTIIRFTWWDVVRRPDKVAAGIRLALGAPSPV